MAYDSLDTVSIQKKIKWLTYSVRFTFGLSSLYVNTVKDFQGRRSERTFKLNKKRNELKEGPLCVRCLLLLAEWRQRCAIRRNANGRFHIAI